MTLKYDFSTLKSLTIFMALALFHVSFAPSAHASANIDRLLAQQEKKLIKDKFTSEDIARYIKQVKDMQSNLIDHGYGPLKINGFWDDHLATLLEVYFDDQNIERNGFFTGKDSKNFDNRDLIIAALKNKPKILNANAITNQLFNPRTTKFENFRNLGISPDGTKAVSFTKNGVEIYDLKTRRMIQRLSNAHTGDVQPFDFSRDGNNLVMRTRYGLISIWNIDQAKYTHHLKLPSDKHDLIAHINALKFIPNTDYLLVSTSEATDQKKNNSKLHLVNWKANLSSEQYVTTLGFVRQYGQFKREFALDVSHDGKIIAVLDRSNTLNLWSVEQKKIIKKHKIPPRIGSASSTEYKPQKISFSNDSSRVYIHSIADHKSKDYTSVGYFDVVGQKYMPILSGKDISDLLIYYDPQADTIFALTDQSKFSGEYDYSNSGTFLWAFDGTSFSSRKKLTEDRSLLEYSSFAVSSAQDLVLYRQPENPVRLYSLEAAQPVGRIGLFGNIASFIDACGNDLIVAGVSDHISFLNRFSGKVEYSFQIREAQHTKAEFAKNKHAGNKTDDFKAICSADGKKLLISHGHAPLSIWDIQSRSLEKIIANIDKNGGYYESVDNEDIALSRNSDRNMVIAAFTNHKKNKRKIYTFDLNKNTRLNPTSIRILTKGDAYYNFKKWNGVSMAPSSDGRTVYVAMQEWSFGAYDISSRKLKKTYNTLLPGKDFFAKDVLNAHKSYRTTMPRNLSSVKKLHYLKKTNKILALHGVSGTPFAQHVYALFYDPQKTNPVRKIKLPVTQVGVSYLSQGENTLFIANDEHFLNIDLGSGDVKKTRHGLYAHPTSITEGHGGKNLLVAFENGQMLTIKKSDFEILTYTIFNEKGKGALTITPEGFFTGSFEMAEKLTFRLSSVEVIPVDNFFNALYRPDLVREKLRGDPKGLVKKAAAQNNFRAVMEAGGAPDINFAGSTEPIAESETVKLSVSVKDNGAGIGRVEWRVNGLTQGLSNEAKSTITGEANFSQELSLFSGTNNIEVVVYDKNNLMSSEPAKLTLNHKGSTELGTLHVLAVGINEYAIPNFKLNYSTADAVNVAKALSLAGKDLYKGVQVHKVLDADATRENLARKFQELAGLVEPQDTFVFFLAGHGKTFDGVYHFVPQDFSFEGPGSVRDRLIGQFEWQKWLSGIRAFRSVLLYDTCESGSAAEYADANASLQRNSSVDRLARATGRAIMAASSAESDAVEGYGGHGLFTFVFLEALAKSDNDKNQKIDIEEISSYLKERVPNISKEAFNHEQVPQIRLSGSKFDLSGQFDIKTQPN